MTRVSVLALLGADATLSLPFYPAMPDGDVDAVGDALRVVAAGL